MPFQRNNAEFGGENRHQPVIPCAITVIIEFTLFEKLERAELYIRCSLGVNTRKGGNRKRIFAQESLFLFYKICSYPLFLTFPR